MLCGSMRTERAIRLKQRFGRFASKLIRSDMTCSSPNRRQSGSENTSPKFSKWKNATFSKEKCPGERMLTGLWFCRKFLKGQAKKRPVRGTTLSLYLQSPKKPLPTTFTNAERSRFTRRRSGSSIRRTAHWDISTMSLSTNKKSTIIPWSITMKSANRLENTTIGTKGKLKILMHFSTNKLTLCLTWGTPYASLSQKTTNCVNKLPSNWDMDNLRLTLLCIMPVSDCQRNKDDYIKL